MVESLTKRVREVLGTFMKLIKYTKDKSIRLKKLFLSQAHIKKIEKKLKKNQYFQLTTYLENTEQKEICLLLASSTSIGKCLRINFQNTKILIGKI